jgi:hypothetical protein
MAKVSDERYGSVELTLSLTTEDLPLRTRPRRSRPRRATEITARACVRAAACLLQRGILV